MEPKYDQYYVPTSDIMVNLCVGKPSRSYLPLDWFQYVCLRMSEDNNNEEEENKDILQYGAVNGYPEIRKKMAEWLSETTKNNISSDNLFMTNGISGTLHLIITKYLKYGDTIIVENPTYFMSTNIFREYGLNVIGIDMEDDGVNIEKLEEEIRLINQPFLFFYTIPVNHNPTGINTSVNKRKRLGELCEKYNNFYIIADEVYHLLSWDNIDSNPMSFYHSKIISLGSFSKILSPSLRVGWILQNRNKDYFDFVGDLINYNVLQSSGGLNPICYKIVEYALSLDHILSLDNNDNNRHIDSIRNNIIFNLYINCNAMIDYMSKHKDIFEYKVPKGGYFIWVRIKDVDIKDFLEHCEKNKVKFHPGIKFYSKKSNVKEDNEYIRLSFSYYNKSELLEGLERILLSYNSYQGQKC